MLRKKKYLNLEEVSENNKIEEDFDQSELIVKHVSPDNNLNNPVTDYNVFTDDIRDTPQVDL